MTDEKTTAYPVKPSTRRDVTRLLAGAVVAGASGLMLPTRAGMSPIEVAAGSGKRRRKRKRRRNRQATGIILLTEFTVVNTLPRTVKVQFWNMGDTGKWTMLQERDVARNLEVSFADKKGLNSLAWIDNRYYVWLTNVPIWFPQLRAGHGGSMSEGGLSGSTEVIYEAAVLVADAFHMDLNGERVDIRRRPDSADYIRFGVDLRVI